MKCLLPGCWGSSRLRHFIGRTLLGDGVLLEATAGPTRARRHPDLTREDATRQLVARKTRAPNEPWPFRKGHTSRQLPHDWALTRPLVGHS